MSILKSILVLLGCSFAAYADITIVSDRSDFHLRPLYKVYSDLYGVIIHSVFLEDGTLPARISSEVDDADVVISKSIDSLIQLDSLKLLRPVPSLSRSNYVPVSFRARVLIYSKDRVPEHLSGYEDLANPKYKGRVCMRSLSHPYNVNLVKQMLYVKGFEYTSKWVRGVKENLAIPPSGNDRAQAVFISDGVCDLALMNTYYYGMLDRKDYSGVVEKIDLFFPGKDSSTGGTFIISSGAAVLSDNPEALDFVRYLLGFGAQDYLSRTTYEYPATDTPVPQSLRALNSKLVDGLSNIRMVDPKDTQDFGGIALNLLR